MTLHNGIETNTVSHLIQSLIAIIEQENRLQQKHADTIRELSAALDRLQKSHQTAVSIAPRDPNPVAATDRPVASKHSEDGREPALEPVEGVDGGHIASPIALATASDAATQLSKSPAMRKRNYRKASSALSQKEQQVWACVHVQGKTVTQASIEFSCTVQNISKHLNNAQRKIKAQQSRSVNARCCLPEDTRGQIAC